MSASSKKTVLITGCTTGSIGAALAKEFHSRGQLLASRTNLIPYPILASNQVSGFLQFHGSWKPWRSYLLSGIETLALDVTDIDAIRKTKEEISGRTGGKLDILVNNAGRGEVLFFQEPSETHAKPVGDAAVADLDMEVVRALYELNSFLPLLIASGKGCVVNNGSVAGIMPIPFTVAYNSSKAALHSFGDTLRIELAPFNVRVVNLITGAVNTNILQPYIDNPPEFFPENSLYRSMEEERKAQIRNSSSTYIFRNRTPANPVPFTETAISAADFARTVVGAVTKSSPPRAVWAGANARDGWLLDTFLPRSTVDWVVANMFGMLKLAARVRSEKSKHT
ncbi:NAD-P-binding protein [Mycena olivaceomarginata]|nr:NAD-P-binding protein [Mycena olivaceomarginata]